MPDGLRGLQIDDQLVAIRYFHRNVGRLGATEHLHHHSRPLTVHVGKAWAVAGKRTCFRGFRPLEDRRQAHCCDAFHDDLVAVAARNREQRRRQEIQCPSTRCFRSVDRGCDLLRPTNAKNRQLDATRPRGMLQHLQVVRRGGGRNPPPPPSPPPPPPPP